LWRMTQWHFLRGIFKQGYKKRFWAAESRARRRIEK